MIRRGRFDQQIARICMLLSLSVFHAKQCLAEAPVIQISSGPIQGVTLDDGGSPAVTGYLGVPYGEPTDGLRRFAAPEPVAKWTETRLCDKLASTCFYTLDSYFPGFSGSEMWNGNTELSEDCLNLNMWVPEVDSCSDLPVFVWIYGGGYFSGSPSLELYDGRTLARQAQAIVVNINYRLSSFGFLYLGENSEAAGNAGLLDQQMALKWVHDNIAAFGGDPEKVTLVGESAGASSITAHMLAPDSWPYFRNVILQSGTSFNRWAMLPKETMLERSENLADRLGCAGGDAQSTLECMRQVDTLTVQQNADLEPVPFMDFLYVPIDNDGRFFKMPMEQALAEGQVKRCPILMGTNADEGSYWLPYYLEAFPFDHTIPSEAPANQALIDWQQYNASMYSMFTDYLSLDLLVDAAAERYSETALSLGDQPDDELLGVALRDGVSDALADFYFNCDVLRFADVMQSQGFEIFMYHFTQRSSTNPWPLWMGVMHGYEIEYVFGVPIRYPDQYTEGEVEFSKQVITDWSTFANNGKLSDDWPQYSESKEYVILDSEAMNGRIVQMDLRGETCQNWRHLEAASASVDEDTSETSGQLQTDPDAVVVPSGYGGQEEQMIVESASVEDSASSSSSSSESVASKSASISASRPKLTPRERLQKLARRLKTNCVDASEHCPHWAANGGCTDEFRFWMLPNCQVSCDSCGFTVADVDKKEETPGCSNADELCQFWSTLGECDVNAVYMHRSCALSCGTCGRSSADHGSGGYGRRRRL